MNPHPPGDISRKSSLFLRAECSDLNRYIVRTVYFEKRRCILTKVVAINGSPKMEKGRTAKILTPFLEGMEKAGAAVELFYARRLNVTPCDGEFYCWNKKPGKCYIEDSMQSLYPKLREADILVLATPVYIPLPGEMQNLINRIVLLWTQFSNGKTVVHVLDSALTSKSESLYWCPRVAGWRWATSERCLGL